MDSGTNRRISALVALFVLATTSSALAAPQVDMFRCGENFQLTMNPTELNLESVPRIDHSTSSKKMTTFVLNAGPGLLAQPAALAAWNQAIAIWEGILQDPITITIDGDFANLGPGVLGGTSPQAYQCNWDCIFDDVKADAAADETMVGDIPGSATINVLVPPLNTFNGNAVAVRANLSAIGVDMDAVDIQIFGAIQSDASMTFANGFLSSFDFDPSDGIDPGKFDFVGIVVHEIGHALGFVSETDDADYRFANSLTGELFPTILDGFRLKPNRGGNWPTVARTVQPGGVFANAVTWDGVQDLAMSTGVLTGDGNQASHWKADEISGTYIGIMDPTLAPGDFEEITLHDIRVFGLIGYDVTNIPDCNLNSVPDADDIALGTSLDCNTNSIPDECDIASGTSLDGNTNGIPDECEAVATDSPVRRLPTIEAFPTPFNPATTLHFYLPQAGRVQIHIYDVAGRWVDTLVDASYPAGEHDVRWQGLDSAGGSVRSGVYYAVYETPQGSQRTKLTLLK